MFLILLLLFIYSILNHSEKDSGPHAHSDRCWTEAKPKQMVGICFFISSSFCPSLPNAWQMSKAKNSRMTAKGFHSFKFWALLAVSSKYSSSANTGQRKVSLPLYFKHTDFSFQSIVENLFSLYKYLIFKDLIQFR